MPLTVLSVASPYGPVGPDALGGAEQVLHQIDAALVRAGHRSLVLACEGSKTAGTLVPGPWAPFSQDEGAREAIAAEYRRLIASAVERHRVHVVHMHCIEFHRCLPEAKIPVLCTLHLPPDWYPAEAFQPDRPDVWLNCVSESQRRGCPEGAPLVETIPNGVPVADFASRHAKRDFAIHLGRICPEKGADIALRAAHRAGMRFLLAGTVSGWAPHRAYFEQSIRPQLDPFRRFVGPIGFARKRRLLSASRCLVLPALACETSSLVSMESLACGTPVVAFPSGAIAGNVEHGRTGFLVDHERDLPAAMRAAALLDPEACRASARQRFSAERMTQSYLETYERLVR